MCIELSLLQEYVWFRKILVLSGMGVSESHSGGRACDVTSLLGCTGGRVIRIQVVIRVTIQEE